MKTKLRIVLLTIVIILLTALAFLSIKTRNSGYKDLLLSLPKTNTEQEISTKKLEEINENNFQLTYENIQERNIQNINTNHDVFLKGTNYTHAQIMKYPLISGGFFTKEMQDEKSKVVVLNQKASFEIFGNDNASGNEISIDNTFYTVVGIIDDRDTKNNNIYIPAASLKETVTACISVLDRNKEISEEIIKSKLKQAGISDQKYIFINIDSISQGIVEKLFVSLAIIGCGFSILILRKLIIAFIRKVNDIKLLLRQYYLGLLLTKKTREVVNIILLSISTISIGAFILFLVNYIFEIYLTWRNRFVDLNGFSTDSFSELISSIKSLETYSNIFFFSFIIIFIIYLLMELTLQNEKS